MPTIDYDEWIVKRLYTDGIEGMLDYLEANTVDDGDGTFDDCLMIALEQVTAALVRPGSSVVEHSTDNG